MTSGQDTSVLGNTIAFGIEFLSQLCSQGGVAFYGYLVGGIFLGILMWFLVSYFANGVNNTFHLSPAHHVLCSFASIFTLIVVLLFGSLQYADTAVTGMVSMWADSLKYDKEWKKETFNDAYDAVYALKDASGNSLEDFTKYPNPRVSADAHIIPTTHERSQKTVVQTYIDAILKSFDDKFPLLSWVIFARSGSSMQIAIEDMHRTFAEKKKKGENQTHSVDNHITNISKEVLKELKIQTPRIVTISRIALVVAFFIVQFFTFAVVMYVALKGIKDNFSIPR